MRFDLALAGATFGAWLVVTAPPLPWAAADGQAPDPSTASQASPDSAPARRFPPPDPRAFRDSSLTYAEQEALDHKLREERSRAGIDTMALNGQVVLALHAAPTSERRSAADVAALAADCGRLVTAVPPGDWDVFLIAAGFDLMNGIAFSFDWPDGWVVRGFTLNPQLGTPFVLGDLRASDPRPYLVAFDCVARADRDSILPAGVRHTTGDIVVIGRLEVTASSPGSLSLADHSNADYGGPEVANCSRRQTKVPASRRGRIDVGQGPGFRPCTGGAYGVPPPPETPKAAAPARSGPHQGGSR